MKINAMEYNKFINVIVFNSTRITLNKIVIVLNKIFRLINDFKTN